MTQSFDPALLPEKRNPAPGGRATRVRWMMNAGVTAYIFNLLIKRDKRTFITGSVTSVAEPL